MLKRLTINRIDPISAGKVFGVINLVIGILYGLSVGMFLTYENGLGPSNGMGPWFGMIMGVIALCVAPIAFGVLGFVSGLLMSVIHNSAVRYMGGLILEVIDDCEDDDE